MCRLLGVVATFPATVPELLGGDLEPFFELASEHSDGWGISFIDGDSRVVTVKEPLSALRSATVRPLMERIVTRAAILHLRMSSPGSLRVLENTHPFGTAERAFAHNGQFDPVEILDEILGASVTEALGGTDSERYYLAIRNRIRAGLPPAAAIAETAGAIRRLAKTWESTNCLLITPDGVYAYADHNASSTVIRQRGPEFFDLRYQTAADRVVVASTGWSRPDAGWTQLPDRQILEIEPDLMLTVHEEYLQRLKGQGLLARAAVVRG